MSFAALKQKSSLEILTKKLETKSYKSDDERFWQPTQDAKTGLGSAVIRFLPTTDGDDAPWVEVFNHGFKNEETGRWFIEECPSTMGADCPVCAATRPLWNGTEADKKIAKDRGRRRNYISNILVIKDPANPENDGKVFLFKYGKQIFDKIVAMIKPSFEDETPINPMDFWQGCDFKLRIHKNEGGYRSYDKSAFDQPSALYDGDDEKLEALWKSQHKLSEFKSPEKFKSFDDLKKKYDEVVSGVANVATSAANKVLEELGAGVTEAPKFKSAESKAAPETKVLEPKAKVDDDDDWSKLLDDL